MNASSLEAGGSRATMIDRNSSLRVSLYKLYIFIFVYVIYILFFATSHELRLWQQNPRPRRAYTHARIAMMSPTARSTHVREAAATQRTTAAGGGGGGFNHVRHRVRLLFTSHTMTRTCRRRLHWQSWLRLASAVQGIARETTSFTSAVPSALVHTVSR